MLIGSIIYIVFRDKNLLMFKWFDILGLSNQINYIRLSFSETTIPNYILFNYPDGVWIYSFVSLMLILWKKIKSNFKYFWYFIAPILGIFAEIGQYINWVPGTFDFFDLIFFLLGSFLPFILVRK